MNEPVRKEPWLLRMLRPKIAIPVFVLALLAVSPFLIRGHFLSPVPSIPEPFDVDEFCRSTIPAGQNAFEHYTPAAVLARSRNLSTSLRAIDGDADQSSMPVWDVTDKQLQELVAKNQDLLQQWRVATKYERGRYLDPKAVTYDTPLEIVPQLRAIGELAQAQAALLEAAGDVEAAWGWHVAGLRGSRHLGMTGGTIGRLVGIRVHLLTVHGIAGWAALPATSAEQLRRALNDLQESYQLTPPLSDAVKCDYLCVKNTLTQRKLSDVLQMVGTGRHPMSPLLIKFSWFMGEPELTLRVARHVVAHQLPEVDESLITASPVLPGNVLLFERDPATTPAGSWLTPAQLEYAIDHSLAIYFLNSSHRVRLAVFQEQGLQSVAMTLLAAQEYQRLHGRYPDQLSQLVPDLLPEIPTDPCDPSGAPLRYKLTDDEARIWSVGQNGVDDGGVFGHGRAQEQRDVGLIIRIGAGEAGSDSE